MFPDQIFQHSAQPVHPNLQGEEHGETYWSRLYLLQFTYEGMKKNAPLTRTGSPLIASNHVAPDLSVLQLNVLRQFRLIYGSVRQHFRNVESVCGISGSQLWVLRDVAVSPDTGISELARRLSIHQSTCSQLAEKLVSAGLLVKTRSTSDQRRVGLRITNTGARLLRKAPGPAEGVLPLALRKLPDAALRTLQLNLDQLIDHLQLHDKTDAKKPLADL